MSDPIQILKSSQNILLVDWPNPGVPRALLNAGFTVFCSSPDKYTRAEIAPSAPGDVDKGSIFPPGEGDKGWLVFRRLDGDPPAIDLVNVYRPVEELPGILERHALRLGARSVWLHPPAISDAARSMTEERGLLYVEGHDIAAMASGPIA